LVCLLALVLVKAGKLPLAEAAGAEFVTVRRKVGGCIGCGRCNIGCPLVVEYRVKADKARK
jgi:Fe-S-cluster-containing dehydrogenase component